MNIQLNVRPIKKPGSRLSLRQKHEMRERAVEQIRALLAVGSESPGSIAEKLKLSQSSAYAYLKYMACELREVRRTGRLDSEGRHLWELGDDSQMQSRNALIDQGFAPKRPIGPARQIGMQRDPLVQAIFGPAA